MRSLLFLAPVLAVAACATPRENCISSVNSELRTLQKQIVTAQDNIQRGFAVFEQTGSRTVSKICRETRKDGTIREYSCDDTESFKTEVPVAIDVAEERRKLKDLRRRLGPTERATDRAVQRCIARHPE